MSDNEEMTALLNIFTKLYFLSTLSLHSPYEMKLIIQENVKL